MKVLVLTNNSDSYDIIDWLSARVDVVMYDNRLTMAYLDQEMPDLVISYLYRYVIPVHVLQWREGIFINLHLSFLPFNRGADPNAWAFLDDTPSGVSIHVIDKGIDTGPILAQRLVVMDGACETLRSSFDKLKNEMLLLFISAWSDIAAWRLVPWTQPKNGTFHVSKELNEIKDELLGPEGVDVHVQIFKERFGRLRGIRRYDADRGGWDNEPPTSVPLR